MYNVLVGHYLTVMVMQPCLKYSTIFESIDLYIVYLYIIYYNF